MSEEFIPLDFEEAGSNINVNFGTLKNEAASIPFKNVFKPAELVGLNRAMSLLFTQLHIFREGDGREILFSLKCEKFSHPDGYVATGSNNKHMTRLGPASWERAYNAMATTSQAVRIIHTVYSNAVAGEKKPPIFQRWFEGQFNLWKFAMSNVNEKRPVCFSNDSTEACLSYVDLEEIDNAPDNQHPAWDSFVAQFGEYGSIFMAWVYASIDALNIGRQMLVVMGPGADGKGCVCNALASALPLAARGISASSISGRFAASNILGAHLLMYADCKDPRVVTNKDNSLLHNVTGNDTIMVEFKGETAFSEKIHCKVMIMSNVKVKLSAFKVSEKSRVIPLKIDPSKCIEKGHKQVDIQGREIFVGDNTYEKRLKEQLFSFLKTCKKQYQVLCPTRSQIIVPDDIYGSTDNGDTEYFESFIDKKYIITKDSNDYVWRRDVRLDYEAYADDKSPPLHDLYSYLESLGIVEGKKEFKNSCGNKVEKHAYIGMKNKVGD